MSNEQHGTVVREVDVVVVGAGFAGLYLLHKLRGLGFSVRVLDTAAGVGGTWYWNRYPGARCDVESIDYSYSFDPDLDEEWQWSERYATQPEILSYLEHVADRFDLRSDISFSTTVDRAVWNDVSNQWQVTTTEGLTIDCQFYVMASGCLSVPKIIDIPGADRFSGDVHMTGRWPHEGVDFTGQRVGLIGTGSSAIQAIPVIAGEAASLTVFQRTPNYSIPAHNGPQPADKVAAIEADRAGYRQAARWSPGGVPVELSEVGALMVSDEERHEKYEAAWEAGGLFATLTTFNDLVVNPAANETISSFIRHKIHTIVDDPATASALSPTSYPFGTKRPCLDDNYYAVYNQPSVSLVDLDNDPIVAITESGIETEASNHEFDVLVFATGFDAMTGALVAVDVVGHQGLTLADKWAGGPKTYLGLTTVGFPNFFTITGPGSPSVLSNMVVSIEQHVDWICDAVTGMRDDGYVTIEPTDTAETAWGEHVNGFAALTLYPQANSWYMGANVPGKPRVFLPYVGGVDTYRQICDDVAASDYLGFARTASDGSVACVDGVVCPLQPDVMMLLKALDGMGLPPIESMTPVEARAFMEQANLARPPGPEVGEVTDGSFDGPGGPLAYRVYRPDTVGPHPIVAYFHGGGWVLGDATSDDPMCRDLCLRADVVVVSFDYRHAPEAPFPAAVHDAIAAVNWLAEHAEDFGGLADRMAVAGWSAGGNLAAAVSQHAKDNDGPAIRGQVLLTPVTDGVDQRQSMIDNGEGYVLTAPLMEWFWNHYAEVGDRKNPLASPLRAANLSGLPPTMVVTAEFDPLRDEGVAYADALAAAGVPCEHLAADGQIHTSVPAVDLLVAGVPVRQAMAEALERFLR